MCRATSIWSCRRTGFAGEYAWGWTGFLWGRRPLVGSGPIGALGGGAARASIPAETNQYLFSTFGNVGRGTLVTASRSWIVLLASGAALIVGLLLIYVPATRHPAALLVAGGVLATLGILYPEPACLAAQAGSLGLMLALVAALLARGLGRPHQEFDTVEMVSAVLDSGVAVMPSHRRPSSVAMSTATQSARAIVLPSPPESAHDAQATVLDRCSCWRCLRGPSPCAAVVLGAPRKEKAAAICDFAASLPRPTA